MKQAFYKLLFVALFISIITAISGAPQSIACGARPVKKACVVPPKLVTEQRFDDGLSDVFFITSIFQL